MNDNKNFSIDMNISYICQNEYNYFLNKKGVVGVALGYKRTHGFSTFKKCITVFVQKKLPCSNLSKQNIIPKCYRGILTDVIESGVIEFNSLTSKVRPNINGYSIGNMLSIGSGTSACLVHDKNLYILGCNHVLALNNSAQLESNILQPSVGDGGDDRRNIIGRLDRFVPLKFKRGSQVPENIVDCALCRVSNRAVASPEIAFVGLPKGVAKPKLDESVKKVGRTTELTHGKITNLNATIATETSLTRETLFKNQIITTKIGSCGDSGSLLLRDDNYALGLYISGSSTTGICNPIDEVLKELKVELVTH